MKLLCLKAIRSINQFKFTTVTFILIFLTSSCVKQTNTSYNKLKKDFQTVDSLFVAGKQDSALKLTEQLRPQIASDNPVITTYYFIKANHNDDGTFSGTHSAKMNLYADSAIAFFKNESRIKEYPNEYFQAVLLKGDACMRAKKYIAALDYYNKGKKVLADGSCDDGNLAQKMAYIYFSQKKYKLAAKYWAEGGSKLLHCVDKYTPQRLFFMRQGAFSNAGFAYFKAGINDSAQYYFIEDLKLIAKAEESKLVGNMYINGAREVVYDNLAGLNMRKGNWTLARQYLDSCFAIPVKEVDGLHIPPYIKLAELSIQSGDYKKAEEAFSHARALLNLYYKDNPDLNLEWNHQYAAYLFKIQKPIDAYKYQEDYIRIKDSINTTSASLYQLDVERELNTLNQRQSFSDLQRRNQSKKIYLTGIGVIVVLTLVIMVMMIRNLKKTQRNHKNATIHNQQLHVTLDELERVNKNYIRIMRVMAHDLRNPLSGMTGLATMLLGEDEFSEESRHMLKLIETTGIYSMEMISELLKSGLADESEVIEKQNLDLRALLYDSVELLQFKAKEKGQEITFNGGDSPIVANVNHEKIWRVFNNLIVNAIKFSHEGGAINVTIQQEGADVLIAVEDSGIGIPDKESDSIFEMFTPAKKFGTNGEQPFGLGLSISKRIIERHNGRIWFKSQVGMGTTFYISLPIAS
ncbi:tetratricopeptide repeat-containing sensor histidine kinase [Mucilaginibacter jinjuensis]|uniref:histidine kinase n=1 Tax=Mucilaginibacter jinjuensis TaxID=1176721 RepID=A0ABY7T373_9SPHI|nr:tetratricopeptide repeat-containing sensor histidine kinase [Mucilaginibacter jinjuensis]WCT10161.1 tetratricopeptide repeat-containing sensor histidine kinase [Mucilaginibacter jinjuensis]